MKEKLFSFALLIALAGCATGRSPVPPGEVPRQNYVLASDEAYGHEVLNGLVEQFPLDTNDANVNRVRDLVDKLTHAAGADQNPWQVYVLKDDTFKNAAATRGNFVFIWTGMLDAVHNDGELATILAHEIAHVLAGHPNPTPQEEINGMISGVMGSAAGQALAYQGAGPLADLAEILVGAAVNAVIVNPGQQKKEFEADQIGLFVLADAGFDPQSAIDFWARAESDPELSGSSLQFLSSHPSSSDRLVRLQALLPMAQARYDQSTNRTSKTEAARNQKTKTPPPSSTWEVAEESTDVHSKASEGSSVLATLLRGERVGVRRVRGKWIEIVEPMKGFVRNRDLDPVS